MICRIAGNLFMEVEAWESRTEIRHRRRFSGRWDRMQLTRDRLRIRRAATRVFRSIPWKSPFRMWMICKTDQKEKYPGTGRCRGISNMESCLNGRDRGVKRICHDWNLLESCTAVLRCSGESWRVYIMTAICGQKRKNSERGNEIYAAHQLAWGLLQFLKKDKNDCVFNLRRHGNEIEPITFVYSAWKYFPIQNTYEKNTCKTVIRKKTVNSLMIFDFWRKSGLIHYAHNFCWKYSESWNYSGITE